MTLWAIYGPWQSGYRKRLAPPSGDLRHHDGIADHVGWALLTVGAFGHHAPFFKEDRKPQPRTCALFLLVQLGSFTQAHKLTPAMAAGLTASPMGVRRRSSSVSFPARLTVFGSNFGSKWSRGRRGIWRASFGSSGLLAKGFLDKVAIEKHLMPPRLTQRRHAPS